MNSDDLRRRIKGLEEEYGPSSIVIEVENVDLYMIADVDFDPEVEAIVILAKAAP